MIGHSLRFPRTLLLLAGLSVTGAVLASSDTIPGAEVRPLQADERSLAQLVEDAAITAAIKSKLVWDEAGRPRDIDVDTANGQVVLRGSVEDEATRRLAQQVAEQTAGVRAVDNRLTLVDDRRGAAGQARADAWITTLVRGTLLRTTDLDAHAVTVETRAGVVHLSGRVAHAADRDALAALVRGVRGVQGVDTRRLRIDPALG
ncbi:MAG TPA: BON domain-containing protein [Candidatus Competibacteraceae bacterium]|nr:BON domain-containing protein [Candidatus Competibacteraceae bacterium]